MQPSNLLPKILKPLFHGMRSLLFVSAAGLVLTGASVSAHAQTPDYTAFQSALQANGATTKDGLTIQFPLVRQDLSTLTISLHGGAALPATPESVANGYLSVQQVGSTAGTYFFAGAFPALASELPALQQSLHAAGLPMTAINTETAGLSQPVVTVHIEGTLPVTDTTLAAQFAAALATIQNPQLSITVSLASPSLPAIPKRFQALVNDGVFLIFDDSTLAFIVPRADAVPVKLGTVTAIPAFGVQQTVYITGSGFSVMNATLALLPHQVQKVSAILTEGGFTLSAQGGYFVDDSRRITFLHAVATASDSNQFDVQGEALARALVVASK